MNSFGVKSILDYSVEVDEAEDAKKEEKKAWTFKKVDQGAKVRLLVVLKSLLVVFFCKIAFCCVTGE